MKRLKISLGFAFSLVLLLAQFSTVLAHDAPDDGAEWLMADWMLLSFLVFFGVALIAFVIAMKRGLLSNLEQTKYYLLTIDEPDYYTPDWAKEAEDDTFGTYD